MGHSNSDTVITRLIIILSKLNDGDALLESELVDEFGVTLRTIQRDFTDRLHSFPIYKDKVNKRWRMEDEFKIEKINNINDKLILDILEKITDGVGGEFAIKSKNLLDKLKNSEPNSIYVKINMEDISDKASVIEILEKAIKEKKELGFFYKNNGIDGYDEIVQPLKIGLYEGFWYLIAFINNQDIRRYYINDLENVFISSQSFEVDIDIYLATLLVPSSPRP